VSFSARVRPPVHLQRQDRRLRRPGARHAAELHPAAGALARRLGRADRLRHRRGRDRGRLPAV